MSRHFASVLATGLLALVTATAAGAATITVQIKSGGFSPAAITINHGDRVTWHNADTTDHQVVADDGSFASPILRAGQSWAETFSIAGTFKYHDALHPRLTGAESDIGGGALRSRTDNEQRASPELD